MVELHADHSRYLVLFVCMILGCMLQVQRSKSMSVSLGILVVPEHGVWLTHLGMGPQPCH